MINAIKNLLGFGPKVEYAQLVKEAKFQNHHDKKVLRRTTQTFTHHKRSGKENWKI